MIYPVVYDSDALKFLYQYSFFGLKRVTSFMNYGVSRNKYIDIYPLIFQFKRGYSNLLNIITHCESLPRQNGHDGFSRSHFETHS